MYVNRSVIRSIQVAKGHASNGCGRCNGDGDGNGDGNGCITSLQSALRRCQWSPGVRTDSSHHGSGHASWHTSAGNRHARNRTLIHVVVQGLQLDVIVIVVAGTTGALQGDDGLLFVAWLVLIQRLDIDGLQSVCGITGIEVESLIATLAI